MFRRPLVNFLLGVAVGEEVTTYICEFSLSCYFVALPPAPYRLVLNTLFLSVMASPTYFFAMAFLAKSIDLQEFVWAFLFPNGLQR